MDLKSNINRIHSIISDKYDNVELLEKSSLEFGKYFEISINENLEVKMILPYSNLDNKSVIKWKYLSNPMNEKSDLVERESTIDGITKVVDDILINKRFSKEYLDAKTNKI